MDKSFGCFNNIPFSVSLWLCRFGFISAFIYAINIALAPKAYQAGAQIFLILTIRYMLGFVIANFFLYKEKNTINFKNNLLTYKNIWNCLALLGVMGSAIGLTASVNYIPVSVAITIYYAYPVFTYIIEKTYHRSCVHPVVIIALFMAILGVALLSNLFSSQIQLSSFGLGLALLGMAGQTSLGVILKEKVTMNNWEFLRFISFVPMIIFAMITVKQYDLNNINAKILFWCFILGCAYCSAFVFYLKSVYLAGASRTSNILYLEAVFAIILSYILYDDHFTKEQIFGISLIIFSLIFIEWKNHQQKKNIMKNY